MPQGFHQGCWRALWPRVANANPSSEVFPLGFPEHRWSELSAVKIKRSLAGVWEHSLLVVQLLL